MTREEAAGLIAICIAIWPKHEIPDEEALLKGWQYGLASVPIDQAEIALAEWIETGTRFPYPADIRKIAKASEPLLDSRLYGNYAALRNAIQAGQSDDRTLDAYTAIQRKIGVRTSTIDAAALGSGR